MEHGTPQHTTASRVPFKQERRNGHKVPSGKVARPSPQVHGLSCAQHHLHGWAIASLSFFPHQATTARNITNLTTPPASSVRSPIDLALRCAKLSHTPRYFSISALHCTAPGITSPSTSQFCLFGVAFQSCPALPCPAPFLYRPDRPHWPLFTLHHISLFVHICASPSIVDRRHLPSCPSFAYPSEPID